MPSNEVKKRFEQLALPQLDAVYRMARRLASDVAQAEDLVQETYVRAYRAFETFQLRDYGIKPWLLRILHNVFYTAKGRQKREPNLMDDVDFVGAVEEAADEGGAGMDNLDWDAFDQELKAAVESLQPDYRVVLLLWAVEELSYKEIAQVCQCPIGTVMSRLYRARQLLSKKLRDYARRRNIRSERL